MRFGRTLKNNTYPPWKEEYIEYDKLKKLLRESSSAVGSSTGSQDDDEWTEDDESAFVEELVNVQLEKVAAFQSKTLKRLDEETSECEQKLEPLGVGIESGKDGAEVKQDDKPKVGDEEKKQILEDVLKKLDSITKETNELERYSRINYSGFLKACKKHDRKRGNSYRVRPLMQVRLAALPFYSEDYTPMLYRLSAMYSFVRQTLDGKAQKLSFAQNDEAGTSTYTSYKYWVHPENLLEVKTIILRRLPVLVYNPQTSKIAEGHEPDPTVTSIYFDNPKFSLYSKKVQHEPDAPSLRLRWYGQLSDNPDVLFEKKIIKEGDVSEEHRFPIKNKYIKPFIKDEYHMEKSISRLADRAGSDSTKVEQFKTSVADIQSFIKENQLQPLVRANYTRTAFEIPGDDRIRISLDTNLAFIREDAIDSGRPCRDPEDWHRSDIDNAGMTYPFSPIRKGEINRFPFALLEIKIRGRKKYEWIDDLMSSHLVQEAPKFSKFVHGVAELFEDYVNSFPFWLSLVETDIRRDPHEAFEEEQEKKAKNANDEFVIGSLFGAGTSGKRGSFAGVKGSSFKKATPSPIGSPAPKSSFPGGTTPRATADMTRVSNDKNKSGKEEIIDEMDSDEDDDNTKPDANVTTLDGLRNLFPAFSTSRYARAHRGGADAKLPQGISRPEYWIKDQGPIRVEAKVWLANQRTFVKWQHVTVLLASLGLGLYNAAGVNNDIARGLAVAYTMVAVFAGIWGWSMYMYRSRLIRTRSGVDFDNIVGPTIICGGLLIALLLNFVFKYRAAMAQREGDKPSNDTAILTTMLYGGLEL
ncbi:SPX-domain-containing protein [Tothia fuscella]|uniref:SPX-domain-containing protein n=1 Tax=Tothia fuscella TaxID=1048955 RepID=A0A9P4NUW6_9PEZI|nr:SPX-domain-containing protein [Tothia fuscella]